MPRAIFAEPFRWKPPGLASSGLAPFAGRSRPFATIGGVNALAVSDVSGTPRLRRLILTTLGMSCRGRARGWIPESLRFLQKCARLMAPTHKR